MRVLAALLLLHLALPAAAQPATPKLFAVDPSIALHDAQAVQDFYAAREYRAVWLGPTCRTAIQELLLGIDSAFEHGLDPADYHHEALSQTQTCSETTEWLATDSWLRLASHLYAGKVDPKTVEPDWTLARPSIDGAATLERAVAEERIAATLRELAPEDPGYAALREALARYRGYLGRGGWVGVDPGATLRKGDVDPRVAQLRARLVLGGMLDPQFVDVGEEFDEVLEDAVKAYQRRANLEPDGLVGTQTLTQLNLRAEHRVAQLRANLERWRWLREARSQQHLRVNIADFTLQAWDAGTMMREYRVIVGREFRRTPSFSGRINQIVFNPWWETPHSLAVKDKLPLFQRDPDAVERLGFEVIDSEGARVDPAGIDWTTLSTRQFPFRLRQRPGPQNALGKVKILFPNTHSVYLHDTPTRGLFGRVRRDYSSGCIRVEDALGLAEWLLADTPDWRRDRIDAAVASGNEQSVQPASSVPVHIVYLTAVPMDDGGVRFVDDLYGRDPELIGLLDMAADALR